MRSKSSCRGSKTAKTHLLLDGNVVVRFCVGLEAHVDGRLGGFCCCAKDQVFLGRVVFPPSAPEAAVEVLVAFELEERRCAKVRSCGRGRRGIRGDLGGSTARENHS